MEEKISDEQKIVEELKASIRELARKCVKFYSQIGRLEDAVRESSDKRGKVRDPQEGDKYWYIDYVGRAMFVEWTEDLSDMELYRLGNLFYTREDAEKEVRWLKARDVLLQDMEGFRPNLQNYDEVKYIVYYDQDACELEVSCEPSHLLSPMCFATYEKARESLATHPMEWKTYLGMED